MDVFSRLGLSQNWLILNLAFVAAPTAINTVKSSPIFSGFTYVVETTSRILQDHIGPHLHMYPDLRIPSADTIFRDIKELSEDN
mgnify:CR=1 FL=1